MNVIALAGFVVETQNACSCNDVRQAVFQVVLAAWHFARYPKHAYGNEGVIALRVSVIEDQLGRHVEYDSNTVHCCKYLQQLPYSIKSNDAGLRRLFPQMCRRNGSLGMVRQRKCRPVATAARLGSESDRPLWPTCTLSLSGRFQSEAAVAGKRRVTAARRISQIGAGGVIAVLVREHAVQRENIFAAVMHVPIEARKRSRAAGQAAGSAQR